MQLGVYGLGRMGGNIVRRLLRHGHECVIFNRTPEIVQRYAREGAIPAAAVEDIAAKLKPPRAVWLMLPAGAVTEAAVAKVAEALAPGDVIIDGGNTFWKDDIRRAAALKAKGLDYVDVGTSGGIWGLERGYCMMIGGDKAVIDRLDPIFSALAPGPGDIARTPRPQGADPRAEQGYIHAGPNGAGHFVKMIHNGIEYGLMQAYAEGFDVLRNAASDAVAPEHRMTLNLADIAEVWRRGSVISSWLLDLTAAALAADQTLGEYSGYVEDSGEGRWALLAAIEEAVPADVLAVALNARFRSRRQHTFAEKVLSAMRKGFGGHAERPGKKET